MRDKKRGKRNQDPLWVAMMTMGRFLWCKGSWGKERHERLVWVANSQSRVPWISRHCCKISSNVIKKTLAQLALVVQDLPASANGTAVHITLLVLRWEMS